MLIKINSKGLLICFCYIFFVSQLVSAQESNFAQLLSIAESSKLSDSKGLLAPFYDGQEYIKVIVSLVHSPEAEALSQQSRASSPATLNQPPGTLYFNLQNEKVKSQLRDTVRRKIDSVASSFDTANIEVTRKYTYVSGFSATVNVEGLQQLIEMEEVVDVSEDFVLEAHLAQGIPLMSATIPRSSYNGAGMSIAICDTGIDTAHPRLGNGGSPIFNSKVIGGYDTGDLDGDPRPSPFGEPHGTACAGISAGNLGTVGDYIGGVAPGSKLYAIKISFGDTISASTAAMIAGWEWAVTHKNDDPANPIMIISTSFGGGRFFGTCDTASAAMTQAAANAIAAGITIFASSGNEGYCDSMAWPACISSVNAVGAVYDANIGPYYPCVNENSCASKLPTTGCATGWYAIDSTAPDKVTSYSNSASFLTLFGPAEAACTTDIAGAGGYSEGDYATSFGGTSAACPYVAGAAAVLQSAAKSLTGRYLTPAQVKLYLTLYGNNLTDGKVNITAPRVNVAASVSHLSGTPPPGDKDFPWVLYWPILTP